MKNTAAILFIFVIFAVVFLVPFAVIWALNTLFALGIPYTIWTWLAMLFVTGTFGKTSVKRINKS